jgi:hypothetical protein
MSSSGHADLATAVDLRVESARACRLLDPHEASGRPGKIVGEFDHTASDVQEEAGERVGDAGISSTRRGWEGAGTEAREARRASRTRHTG